MTYPSGVAATRLSDLPSLARQPGGLLCETDLPCPPYQTHRPTRPALPCPTHLSYPTHPPDHQACPRPAPPAGPYRVNLRYLIRCGWSASFPRRRFLSTS